MKNLKKTGLIILVICYMLAGLNHFRAPLSYEKIIPAWLPWHVTLNYLAGFFEIAFSILLIFGKTRRIAAFGIILMLLAFLPVHISMIANAPIYLGDLKVTPFIAWIRLVLLHPLLILWAYFYTNNKNNELIE